MVLFRLPAPCRAATCKAFSCGSAAEGSVGSSAVPSPGRSSEVTVREAAEQGRTQVPKQQLTRERFAFHAAQLFPHPSRPPLPAPSPSPLLLPALPGARFGTKV